MDREEQKRDPVSVVDEHRGAVVVEAARLFYVWGGTLDRQEGELQLAFADGRALLLGGDSTGELLRVDTGRWHDPFGDHLSADNEDYLRRHGRSVMTDVSRDAGYRDILGCCLQSVAPLINRFARVIGVQLDFGVRLVNFFVSGDDCLVTWDLAGMPKWSDAPP